MISPVSSLRTALSISRGKRRPARRAGDKLSRLQVANKNMDSCVTERKFGFLLRVLAAGPVGFCVVVTCGVGGGGTTLGAAAASHACPPFAPHATSKGDTEDISAARGGSSKGGSSPTSSTGNDNATSHGPRRQNPQQEPRFLHCGARGHVFVRNTQPTQLIPYAPCCPPFNPQDAQRRPQ